jgi:hypothetical protein
MEQSHGFHGREMCSFIWILKDEGEIYMEIMIFYVVGKPQNYLANFCVF